MKESTKDKILIITTWLVILATPLLLIVENIKLNKIQRDMEHVVILLDTGDCSE